MSSLNTFKDLFVLGSILGLVLIGVAITLRSGPVAPDRRRGAEVLGNFSRMVVALAGCAVLLTVAQHWAGLRVSFLP